MLPIYFNYIFVHLRQKARLRPKIVTTLNPSRKARPDLQLWFRIQKGQCEDSILRGKQVAA